jgi:hypothetical protein
MQRKSTKRAKEKQVVDESKTLNPETKQIGIADVHEVVFIRNRIIYRALQILPWLAAVVLICSLIFITEWLITAKVMFNSGLFIVVIGLFVFQVLAKRVSQVFVTLWKRNIIDSSDKPSVAEQKAGIPISKPSANQFTYHLQTRYQEFLYKFEDLLNHPMQWVMGGAFTAMVLVWEPRIFQIIAEDIHELQVHVMQGLIGVVQNCMEFILAFVMGLLIWRMIVVGIYIWRLGKTFKINPQIGHPDSCGGLEPVGNLCLWNILLIGLPGIYLGGWIIPSQIWHVGPTDPLYQWLRQSLWYSDLFSKLLLIPVAISVFSFFVPLWSIHQAMQKRYSLVKEEMEQLAQSITEIEGTLLEQANTLDQKQADELLKRLKTMQEIYQRNQTYPTWPFNVKGLIKFTSVQLLPILVSLGLSQPIANVIKAILGPQ